MVTLSKDKRLDQALPYKGKKNGLNNLIINQKEGFMSDPSLFYSEKKTGEIRINDYFKKEIYKTENRLKRKYLEITSCKIISNQNFGFWTELFEIHKMIIEILYWIDPELVIWVKTFDTVKETIKNSFKILLI